MGDHSILIANPRDTGMFVRMIKPHQLTGFIGLNTLFVSLLQHPEFAQCDFSKLKLTLSGGTALMDDTAQRRKDMTGCGISEAYGLTERSPAVTMNAGKGLERMSTVGQAETGPARKGNEQQSNDGGRRQRRAHEM